MIVHNAEDVEALARDQRDMADMQHAAAHRLDKLSTKLKGQAVRMQNEIDKS